VSPPICSQCPWRLSNHGQRTPGGFYTAANLRRLWGEIRRGGGMQSCHLTDPSHPRHIEAGCSPNAKTHECPGSVLLVRRELGQMADESGIITSESTRAYLDRRRYGLTRQGILYWLFQRVQLAGIPLLGGPALPHVDEDDAIGLPASLRNG
jgi:hypothetical protein